MSRNRLRRSFTVETKARGRQAPAILPVRAPLLEQPSPAFPSLEAAALFSREPVRPADTGAEAAGRPATRRILPSLIEAPAPEPEPEVIEPVIREPRVRRVKLARAEARGDAPRPEPVRQERIARNEPLAEGLVPPVAAQIDPAQGKLAPTVPAEPARRAGRRAEKALPLGERWKRRLPRVCW